MKYLLVALLLVSGCHTLTPEQETEVRINAKVGDTVLSQWDKLSDADKRGFIFRFTRTCHNIVWTIDGIAPESSFQAPK